MATILQVLDDIPGFGPNRLVDYQALKRNRGKFGGDFPARALTEQGRQVLALLERIVEQRWRYRGYNRWGIWFKFVLSYDRPVTKKKYGWVYDLAAAYGRRWAVAKTTVDNGPTLEERKAIEESILVASDALQDAGFQVDRIYLRSGAMDNGNITYRKLLVY